MRGGGKNPHDAFVDLYGALEIVVRSRKLKAVELTKWLTCIGIDEKDTQLALLNDDLTKSENLVRSLEFNNTGLQGEIRAKNEEIERRREENADLRERYVDHCRESTRLMKKTITVSIHTIFKGVHCRKREDGLEKNFQIVKKL